jgi:hypothetical protein
LDQRQIATCNWAAECSGGIEREYIIQCTLDKWSNNLVRNCALDASLLITPQPSLQERNEVVADNNGTRVVNCLLRSFNGEKNAANQLKQTV